MLTCKGRTVEEQRRFDTERHGHWARKYFSDPKNAALRREQHRAWWRKALADPKKKAEIRQRERLWRQKYFSNPEVREKYRAAQRAWKRKAWRSNPAYKERQKARQRLWWARKVLYEPDKAKVLLQRYHRSCSLWKHFPVEEWFCVKCGFKDKRALEVDHIVPRQRGGTNQKSNLQILCANCHCIKSRERGEARSDHNHRLARERARQIVAASTARNVGIAVAEPTIVWRRRD